MSAESKRTQEQAAQKLAAFVAQEVRMGSDKPAITEKLVGMGVEATAAAQLVDTLHGQVLAVAQQQTFTAPMLVPAMIGGFVAAVAGGGVWGWIAKTTGYEIGYIAWGIGVIAGFAVIWFTGGRRGLPLQVIAVASSALGILIGKYIAFYGVFIEFVKKEHGADAAKQVSILSAGVFQFFLESLPQVVGGYDILWVILALGSAWRIPKSTFGGLGSGSTQTPH